MPRVDTRVLPALTEEEIQTLLNAAQEYRDKAMVLCLLDSGCRAGEFLSWNWSDVNLITGVVLVRHTKNRNERTVYLGKRALKSLVVLYATQGGDPGDPVWQHLGAKKRLHYDGLSGVLKKLSRETGIHAHPHKFRRTFALLSLRNGMDVFSLQRLLGHKDLTVVKRYLDLVQSDLKDAHDRFGPVDNMQGKSDRF